MKRLQATSPPRAARLGLHSPRLTAMSFIDTLADTLFADADARVELLQALSNAGIPDNEMRELFEVRCAMRSAVPAHPRGEVSSMLLADMPVRALHVACEATVCTARRAEPPPGSQSTDIAHRSRGRTRLIRRSHSPKIGFMRCQDGPADDGPACLVLSLRRCVPFPSSSYAETRIGASDITVHAPLGAD